MDSEEQHEIQKATLEGRPQTDEGPYYHEAWWESYKGSVKGKLGGTIIGLGAGTAVGVVAVAILGVTVGLGAIGTAIGTSALGAAGAVIAGFAAGGMLYSAHEFGDIGKVVGSNAAVAEKREQRENARFAALERKIDDLKAMMSGRKSAKPLADAPQAAGATPPAESHRHVRDYRTTHCDEHCPPHKPKFVFWKVAAIGLAVGLLAGAALGASHMAHAALGHLGQLGEALAGHEMLASMTAMDLFGASFGINRDMFRQVFDKTDLMFRGMLHDDARAPQPAHTQEKGQATDLKPQKLCGTATTPIITVVYPDQQADAPQADTFHRDRLAESMRLALLNMDHSKAIRQ